MRAVDCLHAVTAVDDEAGVHGAAGNCRACYASTGQREGSRSGYNGEPSFDMHFSSRYQRQRRPCRDDDSPHAHGSLPVKNPLAS